MEKFLDRFGPNVQGQHNMGISDQVIRFWIAPPTKGPSGGQSCVRLSICLHIVWFQPSNLARYPGQGRFTGVDHAPKTKGGALRVQNFSGTSYIRLQRLLIEPPNLERKAELERERFSRVDNHDHIRDPMEYESWNFSAVVESMHCPESSSKWR